MDGLFRGQRHGQPELGRRVRRPPAAHGHQAQTGVGGSQGGIRLEGPGEGDHGPIVLQSQVRGHPQLVVGLGPVRGQGDGPAEKVLGLPQPSLGDPEPADLQEEARLLPLPVQPLVELVEPGRDRLLIGPFFRGLSQRAVARLPEGLRRFGHPARLVVGKGQVAVDQLALRPLPSQGRRPLQRFQRLLGPLADEADLPQKDQGLEEMGLELQTLPASGLRPIQGPLLEVEAGQEGQVLGQGGVDGQLVPTRHPTANTLQEADGLLDLALGREDPGQQGPGLLVAGVAADQVLENSPGLVVTSQEKVGVAQIPLGDVPIVGIQLHGQLELQDRLGEAPAEMVDNAQVGPGRTVAGIFAQELMPEGLSLVEFALEQVENGQVVPGFEVGWMAGGHRLEKLPSLRDQTAPQGAPDHRPVPAPVVGVGQQVGPVGLQGLGQAATPEEKIAPEGLTQGPIRGVLHPAMDQFQRALQVDRSQPRNEMLPWDDAHEGSPNPIPPKEAPKASPDPTAKSPHPLLPPVAPSLYKVSAGWSLS